MPSRKEERQQRVGIGEFLSLRIQELQADILAKQGAIAELQRLQSSLINAEEAVDSDNGAAA